MKLIHCADIHLDSLMQTNFSKEKAETRNREILGTFERMVKYASDKGVTGILISGDLFDTCTISKLTENALKSIIIGNPDILFFYLRGNHDCGLFLSSFDSIPNNLISFQNCWGSFSIGESDTVIIHGAELDKENAGTIFNSIPHVPDKVNIVMLHGQTVESTGNADGELIDLKRFYGQGTDYLALGHIHKYKEGSLGGNATYCYPGCLEPRGFDEAGEHGFVMLDIDEKTGIITREFIPFASRNMHMVEVDITNIDSSADIVIKAKKELEERKIPDKDMVKVVLTGVSHTLADKNTNYIRERLLDEYFAVKVSDESVVVIDPSEYLLDASLKGEFVRMIFEDASLSEKEKGEIASLGLNLLLGRGLK